MTDKYAVIGNPIEHSKSPDIHAEFARQTNQDMHYEAILAPLDDFVTMVNSLIAKGYKGANVTVPFKFEAYRLANHLERRALDAKAANTMTFCDKGIIADNTDGVGIVRDIEQNFGVTLENKRVLLLGAGGAAEGVAHPIADRKPALLVVANRNLGKAVIMVKKLEMIDEYKVTTFASSTFEGLNGQTFDIIINATSAGLSNTALPIPNTIFAEGCLAYDMMYGRETPFMVQARAAGAVVADGLGMLVEQAAEAFYIWRGIRPDAAGVIQKMRTL